MNAAASHVSQEIHLKVAEWKFDENSRALLSSEPGTWNRRLPWMDRRIGASLSCPQCGLVQHLVEHVHQVDHLGQVTPEWRCRWVTNNDEAYGCGLVAHLVLDTWLYKPAYSIVCMRWRGVGLPNPNKAPKAGEWERETWTVNASTREEALFHAAVSYPDRIIECGRMIGAFAKDGTGKNDKEMVAEIDQVKMPVAAIRSFGGVGEKVK